MRLLVHLRYVARSVQHYLTRLPEPLLNDNFLSLLEQIGMCTVTPGDLEAEANRDEVGKVLYSAALRPLEREVFM